MKDHPQCSATDAAEGRCELGEGHTGSHRVTGLYGPWYWANGGPPSRTPWPASDPVAHPTHYTSHPSGVECIAITEHFGFCIGNAIKYLWRAGLKGDALEDLRKASWYVDREIARREKGSRT